MTLNQFMVARHFARSLDPGKCYCPFHNNRNTPAAYMNLNNVYCFSCQRIYTLYDFQQRFGVRLERVAEDSRSSTLSSIKGEGGLTPNQILFTYPWDEESSQ